MKKIEYDGEYLNIKQLEGKRDLAKKIQDERFAIKEKAKRDYDFEFEGFMKWHSEYIRLKIVIAHCQKENDDAQI